MNPSSTPTQTALPAEVLRLLRRNVAKRRSEAEVSARQVTELCAQADQMARRKSIPYAGISPFPNNLTEAAAESALSRSLTKT